MSKMISTEFVSRAKNIAEHVATRYMWGTFGSQITASLIAQKAAQYPAYYSAARKVSLQNLAGHGVWAFDCVGLQNLRRREIRFKRRSRYQCRRHDRAVRQCHHCDFSVHAGRIAGLDERPYRNLSRRRPGGGVHARKLRRRRGDYEPFGARLEEERPADQIH